jgi:hypothetical protein
VLTALLSMQMPVKVDHHYLTIIRRQPSVNNSWEKIKNRVEPQWLASCERAKIQRRRYFCFVTIETRSKNQVHENNEELVEETSFKM